MSPLQPLTPVDTAPLFGPLHDRLIVLLEGLAPVDWNRPTIAGAWEVRDVAAHLLEVDLRRLTVGRDAQPIVPDRPIASDRDLVAFLNELNAQWVRVARRFSPRVLLDLLRVSGPAMTRMVGELPLHDSAAFAVAWAGERHSENWFDIGRDYTERWHHQMQIRDAVGAPGLLERQWLMPLFDLSVRCLPPAYAAMPAEGHVSVTLHVTFAAGLDGSSSAGPDVGPDDGSHPGSDDGAVWTLRSAGDAAEPAWRLWRGAGDDVATTTIRLDADTAWRLFYNALPPDQARRRASVEGEERYAEPLFRARSVMV